MGIYDRDYLGTERSGERGFAMATRTAVGTLIFVNVVVWILQLLVGPQLTTTLWATGPQLRDLQLWRILSANFAHDPQGAWHLASNMLILFFFGRDVEQLYGKRNFYWLYLAAGILAVVAQALTSGGAPVLGASGAVLAVVVVFSLHFPHRIVYFMFFLPMPVWVLCVLIVVLDVLGFLSHSAAARGPGTQVAHLAHLVGAAFGFAFQRFDLRWERLWSGRGRRRSGKKILSFPKPSRSRPDPKPARDPVSEEIDRLLAKISHDKSSLSEEEWNFLRQNSDKYRSGG